MSRGGPDPIGHMDSGFYFECCGKLLEGFEQRSKITQALPNHSNCSGVNKLHRVCRSGETNGRLLEYFR